MKRLVFSFIFALAFLFFLAPNADAQIGKKRPPKPEKIEEVVPEKVSPYHEWVEGQWKWDRKEKTYDWKKGYWYLPRSRGYGYGYYYPYHRHYYGYGYRYGYGRGYGHYRRSYHYYHRY